jgi:hypothetical protein
MKLGSHVNSHLQKGGHVEACQRQILSL